MKRLRGCGRYLSAGNSTGVPVKVTTEADGYRSAGFGGLQTCGSAWACPVCASKIATGRQADIAQAVKAWQAQGHEVVHVTLTMRHNVRQGCASLWDALSSAWSAATRSKAWRAAAEVYGAWQLEDDRDGQARLVQRLHYVRVVEATFGVNGWHLHVHSLIFCRAGMSPADADGLAGAMLTGWRHNLVRRGFDAPTDARGANGRVVQAGEGDALGDYFTKAQYSAGADEVAAELAHGHAKDGKNGNSTPFGLLRSVYLTGDADALDRWHEWERASKGRRQVQWSSRLRDVLVLDVEATDDELAEASADGEVVAVLDPGSWRQVVARGLVVQLLHAAEDGHVLTWLEDHGLTFGARVDPGGGFVDFDG